MNTISRRSLLAMAGAGALASVLPSGAMAQERSGKVVAWASSDATAELLRARFPLEFPQYELDVQAMADTDVIQRLLLAIQSGGELPDAVQLDVREAGDLFATGQFMDLTAELEPERKNFPDGMLLGANGVLYSYMQGPGNLIVWYNKEVLDGHGLTIAEDGTWDDLLGVARELRDKTGGKSHLFTRPPGYSGFLLYNGFFNSRGGNWWDADGNLIADAELAADTLQFLVDMKNEKLSFASHTSDANFPDLCKDGTMVGFTMNMAVGLGLRRRLPEQEGQWRMTTWPRWSTGAPRQTGNYGGSCWAALANAPNKQGAKDLTMFWLKPEGLKAQFERMGAVPYAAAEGIVDQGVEYPYFGNQKVSQIAMSVPHPPFNFRHWSNTGSALTNAVDLAMSGARTPMEAITDALAELAAI